MSLNEILEHAPSRPMCAGLLAVALTCRVFADDIPVPALVEPEANAFVKEYVQLAEDTIAAAKAGDQDKMKALDAKGNQVMQEFGQLIQKIKPEEVKPLSEFVLQWGDKIKAAAGH